MPLTTGLATPKGPLIALIITEAIMKIIPKTRNIANVLSHRMADELTAPSHALQDSFLLDYEDGKRQENTLVSIIPGTTKAMNPKNTMMPTTIVNAQIQSSLEAANLTDFPRSASPFSICSEAELDCASLGNGEEHDRHDKD